MKSQNDFLHILSSCHDVQNHLFFLIAIVFMLIFVATSATCISRICSYNRSRANSNILETSSVSIRCSGNIATTVKSVDIVEYRRPPFNLHAKWPIEHIVILIGRVDDHAWDNGDSIIYAFSRNFQEWIASAKGKKIYSAHLVLPVTQCLLQFYCAK